MITVKYFATLKKLAGSEEEQYNIGKETSLLNLCDLIGKTKPMIGEMIREKKILVSVNFDMVPLDATVKDGDEVALLPPFSGGV